MKRSISRAAPGDVSERLKVRILLADDHQIFREGLRKLLESETGFEVVGTASDGEEAIRLTHELKPDILLLDLAMPRYPGLEALRDLSKSPVPVRTIILTASIEKTQISELLQLGARGIVTKDSAPELLIRSIRMVMAGQYWLERESVSDLVGALRSAIVRAQSRSGRKPFNLTSRELEMIDSIVAGYTNKDIGQKLSISEQTVKHHLTNIFNKLGVSNRLELVLFAVHHQVV